MSTVLCISQRLEAKTTFLLHKIYVLNMTNSYLKTFFFNQVFLPDIILGIEKCLTIVHTIHSSLKPLIMGHIKTFLTSLYSVVNVIKLS